MTLFCSVGAVDNSPAIHRWAIISRLLRRLKKSRTLGIPFQLGDEVEVIILERTLPSASGGKDRYPLRGKPIQYDAPTEPVAEEEWGVLP